MSKVLKGCEAQPEISALKIAVAMISIFFMEYLLVTKSIKITQCYTVAIGVDPRIVLI